MGLLLALLEELKLKDVKSFCATHFHEIVPFASKLGFKSVHMAVIEEDDTIIMTFKLQNGDSAKS